MRRGTDFVLEQAAWPALLLQEDGRILRANQAARRVFAPSAAANLSSLWEAKAAVPVEKFLAEPTSAGTVSVKLRVADGATAPFVAHLSHVLRDGHRYFVLQLFKDSGSAFPELTYAPPPKESPPPPALPPQTNKSEDEFFLQNAEWPALLVRQNGKVLRVNRAAVRAFGSALEKAGESLDKIWSPENPDSARQFLTLPPPEKPVSLKFHLKSGLPGAYLAQLCVTASEDVFLLQLIPAQLPESSATPAKPVPAVPAKSTPPAASAPVVAAPAVDASLAHKQKLDCALQLARSVSLDFNNALTSILGHTSLLLGKAEASHPWRNSLAEIEKSAAKAAEIANDLAAFSRQEKDSRTHLSGNLNTLLDRTVEVFQTTLQQPIVLSRQFERKLFTANFDEAKMQQALVKLLENAVESIKAEGKITVQTRNVELSEPTQDRTAKLTPGNYVCVEITDTGQGITPEVMPRIFEPFFTTKGARHRGLGLAWVYGIVTNHGGGVAVSSTPAGGTAVRLYLPATTRIAREIPTSPADLSGTQTILFVDDEDLLLTMGQMVLSSFGYTVLTANSGAKALEIFTNSKKRIDLVITDLVMPNMSGRELTEQIHRAAPGTRVLWSSGYVRGASETSEQERYLQKPFTSQDLLRKVKQVLTEP